MSSNGYVTVIFLPTETWDAATFFDPNAFPDSLKRKADACAERLSVVDHAAAAVRSVVASDYQEFVRMLNQQIDREFRNWRGEPNKQFRMTYCSTNFHTCVTALFVALKSLLDVYAGLMGNLIAHPSTCRIQFGKAQWEGKKDVSGGKFLRWLKDTAPKSYAQRKALERTISQHVDEWIQQAVQIRDSIVHSGLLPGVEPMHVMLRMPVRSLPVERIVRPALRGHGDVADYCTQTQCSVRAFLRDTLGLLPNVAPSLGALRSSQ